MTVGDTGASRSRPAQEDWLGVAGVLPPEAEDRDVIELGTPGGMAFDRIPDRLADRSHAGRGLGDRSIESRRAEELAVEAHGIDAVGEKDDDVAGIEHGPGRGEGLVNLDAEWQGGREIADRFEASPGPPGSAGPNGRH